MGEKAMDMAKVVAGVILIIVGIYIFIDSNPVIQNYIRQREYVKRRALETDTNEKEVDRDQDTYEEQINNTNSNLQHTHSFVVITKPVLIQDDKSEVMEVVKQYYRCDCGLELQMKAR